MTGLPPNLKPQLRMQADHVGSRGQGCAQGNAFSFESFVNKALEAHVEF